MKLTIYTLLASCALTMTACHYGADRISGDLERNEEYKAKRAEREAASALPEDAADKMNGKVSTAPADSVGMDTTAGN